MKPEDIKPWKIKRSEYLVKRPWLTARRDVVELPDGREIPEYYVLEYPVSSSNSRFAASSGVSPFSITPQGNS